MIHKSVFKIKILTGIFIASIRMSSSTKFCAHIAIGSNVGNRYHNFHCALQKLTEIGNIINTSYLYESQPMYHLNQPRFLNAACIINTNLNALDLLIQLKEIETSIGRVQTFSNGPRVIDLDIIFYNNQLIKLPNLDIPHPRLHEREFVLRPLCDMDEEYIHPHYQRTVKHLLDDITKQHTHTHTQSTDSIYRVLPLGTDVLHHRRLIRFDNRVLIAGILNVTPDSFSDGGKYNSCIDSAVDHAKTLLDDGADIIDIGGESTRPGSVEVDAEEELHRVIPVIKAIRKECSAHAILSIDTRNSIVAEAAIQAGVDLINDVSGGNHDPRILSISSRHGVPIVLMHMRGTPQTMASFTTSYPSLTNASSNIAADIANDLCHNIAQATHAHIPRWLQITDPGIGFAKDANQNLQLLQPQSIAYIKSKLGGLPMMVGPSRKRFISSIITGGRASTVGASTVGASNEDRDWGTAGACAAAILGGAEIVRVHNVKGLRMSCDVVKAIAMGAMTIPM